MTETQTDNTAANPGKGKEPQSSPKPVLKKEAAEGNYYWGTGRRKTSVARVRIRPGEGKVLVNDRAIENYFRQERDRKMILSPLRAVEGENKFDVFVNVRGGGTTGQTGAVVLGIARALKSYDGSHMQMLLDGGYLTRDPRMVERKKAGQPGARRRFQFSKR